MYIEIAFQSEAVCCINKDSSGWGCVNEENGELIFRRAGGSQSNDANEDITYIRIQHASVEIRRGFSGEQPVYFCTKDNRLFVSDSSALLAEKINAALNFTACYEFIFFEYPGNERTLYDGVKMALNAQTLIAVFDRVSGVEISTVDDFRFPSRHDHCESEDCLAIELRQHITAAHAARSGLSNGVLLSGGIDSQVMAITLTRDLGLKETFATTFAVRGAKQDESGDAKQVVKQLGMQWFPIEVDADTDIDWQEVLRSNSPYIGGFAMRQLLAHLKREVRDNSILFAGQDTRLHTPALSRQDLVLWKYCYRFERLGRTASCCARAMGGLVKELDESAFMKRLIGLFSYSPSFETFLANRYFHVRRFNFHKSDHAFAKVFGDIVSSLARPNPQEPRFAYNKIVQANWRRQYQFDIGHMVGVCESASYKCAMPFYDAALSKFSARIPFGLATITSTGRAGHSAKLVTVNKYLLRKAYEGELDKSLIYRDKAVCATNYLFLNGCLRHLLAEFCSDTDVVFSGAGVGLHLPELQNLCKFYAGRWAEKDNWLCNVVFNALVVWSLLLAKGVAYSESEHGYA